MRMRLSKSALITIVAISMWRPVPAAAVECGDVLELRGRRVVLDHDILDCDQPWSALTIIGPGAFDMNGHILSCKSVFYQRGLVIEGVRARVRSGVVAGCDQGVSVTGSKHRLENLVAHGNREAGFVIGTRESTFRNNSAVDNAAMGFQEDGRRNRFVRNVATGSVDGFIVYSGESAYVGNTAVGNQYGFSSVYGTRQHYANNTATANSVTGIVAHKATTCTFRGNTALGNGLDVSSREDCKDYSWRGNLVGTANEGCVR